MVRVQCCSLLCYIFLSVFVVWLVILGTIWAVARQVDRRMPLEEISTGFEMADGPAWDGYSLIIPDVKGQKLFRYLPAKKQMQTLMPE